jgi:hypothetical protein
VAATSLAAFEKEDNTASEIRRAANLPEHCQRKQAQQGVAVALPVHPASAPVARAAGIAEDGLVGGAAAPLRALAAGREGARQVGAARVWSKRWRLAQAGAAGGACRHPARCVHPWDVCC